MKIKVKRLRDVELPKKAYTTDLGFDFFVPKINDEVFEIYIENSRFFNEKDVDLVHLYFNRENVLYVPFHSSIVIPSGIALDIPKGYGLIGFNRSSVASKKGLILGACVVDSEYKKEVLINLLNFGDDIYLEGGEKIAQFVVMKNYDFEIQEEDFDITNSRDGFGSTDRK